jgi:glycosyltransferase involved in cell wall biosynthesis
MNSKKDILFIMNNLHCGGAEKSLVSLLQIIDYSKYNIDLLLFKKEGVFLDKLPKEVTVLEAPIEYSYFDMSIKSAIYQCFKKGRFDIILNRILAVSVLKTEKNPAVREQKMWKFLSPCLSVLEKKYDVAIGYLEKTPNYFCVDKTKAAKKIAWIHTNYSNMGMQPKYDIPYFKKCNTIVTISSECASDLHNRFPQFSEKIKVIQNIVSPSVIQLMAKSKIDETINFENAIISVGRLSREKGADLAIEACNILKEKNIPFTWIFIGDGSQRNELETLVANYQLQNHVLFLGTKDNPYSYIKRASIYAQTSRFEGKSIALDEAKILQKPIVITNFSTATTQITHLQNGFIADMNPEAIVNGIIEVLQNKALQEVFQTNLSKEKLGTEAEIEHFYQLLEE